MPVSEAAVPVIEARGVVKVFETEGETIRALRGVSLAIEPGEFVAIMGPSGSGKSTLLNVLGLLDEPTEGAVLLDGADVTGLTDRERTRARKQTIGFIFQNYYLISTLTALENVEVPRLLDRDPETPARAAALLESVGLADRLEHKPGELSGGQKQRVAIARALINDPRIVLADEPTGNLDRATGRTVLEQFREVTARGVAIVAVTHDQQVATFADRTVTLVDGLIGSDTPGSGTGTVGGSEGPDTAADETRPGSSDAGDNGGADSP